jgi:hypothetical protein
MPIEPIVTPVPPEPPPPPERPHVRPEDIRAVVVAGVNRPHPDQGNALPRGAAPGNDESKWHRTFFRMAHRYMREWAFKAGGIGRVVIFDFLEGTTLEYVKGSSSEQNGTPVGFRHRPLVDANYRWADGSEQSYVLRAKAPKGATLHYWTGLERYAAAKGIDLAAADIAIEDYWQDIERWIEEENSMRVESVYDYVAHSPDRSVKELHFFGFGHQDGPVLVNTLAAIEGGGPPRLGAGRFDPGTGQKKSRFDKDCRSSDRELRFPILRASWADAAYTGLWGSDAAPAEAGRLLAPVLAQRARGEPMTRSQRDAIGRRLSNTYAQTFALLTQSKVRAAPFGTWAGEDHQPDAGLDAKLLAPKLQHVNFAQCAPIMRLYDEEFGIFFPREGLYRGDTKLGRGFAAYPMFQPF